MWLQVLGDQRSRFKMRNSCIFFFLLLASRLACVQLSGLRQRTFSYYYNMKTWREAQSFCREKHEDLLTIRNETEIWPFYWYQGWLGLYQENDTSPWKRSMQVKMTTFFNWDFNGKENITVHVMRENS